VCLYIYMCVYICILLKSKLFFCDWYWGSNAGHIPWATPPALSCDDVFQDRFSQNVCVGWLWIAIFLISASWVTRIASVSHWCLANVNYLNFSITSIYLNPICYITVFKACRGEVLSTLETQGTTKKDKDRFLGKYLSIPH
jgi:hypothetical protein